MSLPFCETSIPVTIMAVNTTKSIHTINVTPPQFLAGSIGGPETTSITRSLVDRGLLASKFFDPLSKLLRVRECCGDFSDDGLWLESRPLLRIKFFLLECFALRPPDMAKHKSQPSKSLGFIIE